MGNVHLHQAAVLAFTLLLGAGSSFADDKLEGPAAWQKLVGNTVVATTRHGSYTEFYDPGGAVRRVDGDGTTNGSWTLSGDQPCFDYPEDDDHICLRVTVEGMSGTFTDADGVTDTFAILTGNARNL